MRDFDTFVQHFSSYVEEFGDGYVPTKYICSDGYPLGRKIRDIRVHNIQTSSQEEETMVKLGFQWDGRVSRVFPKTFERYYACMKKYYEEHGDCKIPQSYVDEQGNTVGVYDSHIRKYQHTLNDVQRKRLNAIHFVWAYKNKRTSFEDFCRIYKEYENRVGHKYMSNRYVTPDGIQLGMMCRNIREGRRKTKEEEKKKLNEIGFVWDMDKYCMEAGIIRDNRGRKKMSA